MHWKYSHKSASYSNGVDGDTYLKRKRKSDKFWKNGNTLKLVIKIIIVVTVIIITMLTDCGRNKKRGDCFSRAKYDEFLCKRCCHHHHHPVLFLGLSMMNSSARGVVIIIITLSFFSGWVWWILLGNLFLVLFPNISASIIAIIVFHFPLITFYCSRAWKVLWTFYLHTTHHPAAANRQNLTQVFTQILSTCKLLLKSLTLFFAPHPKWPPHDPCPSSTYINQKIICHLGSLTTDSQSS